MENGWPQSKIMPEGYESRKEIYQLSRTQKFNIRIDIEY